MNVIERATQYYTPVSWTQRPIVAGVLHDTETLDVATPHAGGSWHYQIGRDGRVWRDVLERHCAWHVRATDRRRAEERLARQQVDFVVCGQDGRPMYAFDIEQYHLSNAKAKTHQVKMKNRILKTAGVRFLFLKNGIHRMPSPSEFRKQLDLAALPQPIPKEASEPESVRQQLESKFSEFDQIFPATGFRDSEVMGMSGLMDLGNEDSDRQARQRSAVRRRA